MVYINVLEIFLNADFYAFKGSVDFANKNTNPTIITQQVVYNTYTLDYIGM